MINALRQAPREARRRLPAFRDSLWLLAPLALLYGVFALVPFALIVRFAVADGGAPFITVLHSSLLLRAAANTLVISLITTVLALVLAYLLAAGLWRAGPRLRRVLLAFVLRVLTAVSNFCLGPLFRTAVLPTRCCRRHRPRHAPAQPARRHRHGPLRTALRRITIFNAMGRSTALLSARREASVRTASVIGSIFPLTLPGVYSTPAGLRGFHRLHHAGHSGRRPT
jgi:hypothetical protein